MTAGSGVDDRAARTTRLLSQKAREIRALAAG